LKALRGALKRRRELAAEAAKLRKEVENKIEDVKIKISGFEIRVKEAEDALRDTERREKLRVVKAGAGAAGQGKTGVLIGLTKSRVNELRTSLEKTRKQRDNMLGRVTELEGILATLKDEYNPNFNDEGVKRAVRGWEDYAARDTDDGWEEAEDRDLDEIMKEDGAEAGVNWEEFEAAEDGDWDKMSDVAALYQFTSYLPRSWSVWIDEKVASLRQLLVENGVLADSSNLSSGVGATESKAVADAKKTLSDTQRDLTNAQNDLSKTREDLDANYGPNDIFRALKNVCISKESGEYTYELCFMGSTKQKPKRGGADTNMGNFVGWDVEHYDEGRKIVMKYENGQHCWNGPNRSTKVVLECSEREEILKVSESEKCVYRMEVGTSAVCEGNGNERAEKDIRRDEL
jgi:protein kinase C substrate 80K-H